MRFELFTLPVLAALAEAAAISSSPKPSCTTCPVTIQNTAAAISSVMAQMSAQSPVRTHGTVTVTGSPVPSTAVAKMSITTSSAKSSAKTTAKSTAKTTAKTSPSKSSSTKKLQRRIASTSSSISNGACATQANFGYTYVPAAASVTPSSFLSDKTLRTQAMTQNVPTNYTWSYAGYYASNRQNGYMFSTELSSYNVSQCASVCNGMGSSCKGFNIYFERDPTLLPGDGCPNPTPQTSVRCAFYSQQVMELYATNVGQWRSSFAVLITGASGYNKQ